MNKELNDEELKKIYLIYITRLINYFKIVKVLEFRESLAVHIKKQPNIKDEDNVKLWCLKTSDIIRFFTTLSEDELERRFNKEYEEINKMYDESVARSKES